MLVAGFFYDDNGRKDNVLSKYGEALSCKSEGFLLFLNHF